MRDHGGNIDWAVSHYGGTRTDWVDLSTGINRVPYAMPDLPPHVWTDLPTKASVNALIVAAANAYQTRAAILPVAGAQAAIQMIPRLRAPGIARVLSPTYNEHAAALRASGWQVEEVRQLDALAGANLAVVVNPNNPDGRWHDIDQLLAMQEQVGLLVVDESFADPRPAQSLAGQADRTGLLVLKSFGKFYGLAGLRLGFVLGSKDRIHDLAEMAGPWPVSGAAIEIGRRALSDFGWQSATVARLQDEVIRIDTIAEKTGWRTVGGTDLFRLYDTGNAPMAQDLLARSRIWSRIFPYHPTWLRVGLPGSEAEWSRLSLALA